MYIPLRQKQEEPIFSDVTDRVQDETATIIEIKDTNYSVEFPSTMSSKEMARALHDKFHKNIVSPISAKRLCFEGWSTTHNPLDLPFRYIFTITVLLVFVGLVIATLPNRMAKSKTLSKNLDPE